MLLSEFNTLWDVTMIKRGEKNQDNNGIKLYCQSCCERYPYCIDKDFLLCYDRAAETCPDFLPKDINKGIDKAKCWKKRLEVDSDYTPLPGNWNIECWTKDILAKIRRYGIEQAKKIGNGHVKGMGKLFL